MIETLGMGLCILRRKASDTPMTAFQTLLETLDRFPVATDDSRDVVEGAVFVHGGGTSRSREFLREALDRGATKIVADVPLEEVPESMYVRVPDRREAAALVAKRFYRDPSRSLLTVGITGTSGKTTCSYLVESVLMSAGHGVGVIGTENIRFAGHVIDSPNTTPSTFVLNRTLRQMVDAGCTAVVLEVSSHALSQGRVTGIAFDAALFTNLSGDHLDFHETMDAYFEAKSLLFTQYVEQSVAAGKTPVLAVNGDDPYGQRLLARLEHYGRQHPRRVRSYGRIAKDVDISGSRLQSGPDGISGPIGELPAEADRPVSVRSTLVGAFNADNILGVAALARALEISAEQIERGIAAADRPPGRLERVGTGAAPTVVVDFAHKPDALLKVLESLRATTPGRLICVFGCGGRRDTTKRPQMGRIATELADVTLVTSDNSRGEAFEAIAEQICSGIPNSASVRVEKDRAIAIRDAIEMAGEGDCVLIAGRGAETHLSSLLDDGTLVDLEFDDRVVAARAVDAKAAASPVARPI